MTLPNILASPFPRPLPPRREPESLDWELADGYRTRVLHWPAGSLNAAGPVVVCHGIQSHPGWFASSCVELARAGHGVFAVTRRGSGENTAGRGDAPSAERLLDDVATAIARAREHTSAAKVHLVGISWGGKLLAAYAALRKPADVASLTLVAPGIAPRVDASPAVKLGVLVGRAIWPTKRFSIPLNSVEMFTDNEAMRKYLRGDSLRLMKATARFLFASWRLDRLLAGASSGAIEVPTTLLLAKVDRIIDNARTTAVVERLTAGRANVETLAGCHTLEFEEDISPLVSAMLASFRR